MIDGTHVAVVSGVKYIITESSEGYREKSPMGTGIEKMLELIHGMTSEVRLDYQSMYG